MDFKYPFISKILYGSEKMSVTEEELEVVREYLELESEIEDMDRRHIYFCGHTDALAYLKKLEPFNLAFWIIKSEYSIISAKGSRQGFLFICAEGGVL